MKISQFIEALTKLQTSYGDIDVMERLHESNAVRDLDTPNSKNVYFCAIDEESGDEVCIKFLSSSSYRSAWEYKMIQKQDCKVKLVL